MLWEARALINGCVDLLNLLIAATRLSGTSETFSTA